MPVCVFGAEAASYIRSQFTYAGPFWSMFADFPLEEGHAICFLPEGFAAPAATALDQPVLDDSDDLISFRQGESFILNYLEATPGSLALFGTDRSDGQPLLAQVELPVHDVVGLEKTDYCHRYVALSGANVDEERVREAIEISESPFPYGFLAARTGLDLDELGLRALSIEMLRTLGRRADCLIVEAFRGGGLLFWIRPGSDLLRKVVA